MKTVQYLPSECRQSASGWPTMGLRLLAGNQLTIGDVYLCSTLSLEIASI